jgi:hypothetical protein
MDKLTWQLNRYFAKQRVSAELSVRAYFRRALLLSSAVYRVKYQYRLKPDPEEALY